ncbi:capsular polysaccharide biosynthesis protein [Algicella marina]|uniref:Capsular polysaccharide biosynthesis protein n=1 Tax=Algicella marina TaxID=2683284 RepID=A0A6P1ST95_9RHOB|nr:capsular polysaccharide biosynthesis protein [Algicella marina]QHQ33894.1 capsular polysaccharide biosynthesis protein [Algicella marina]
MDENPDGNLADTQLHGGRGAGGRSADGQLSRHRLGVYTLGFLNNRPLRRILSLAGWEVVPGWRPGTCDAIGVWGRRPVSSRGLAVARRTGVPVLNVEDAFLRSVRPGYAGEPPTGIILDDLGLYFDASQPSRLEEMLQSGDLSDPALMARAAAGIAFLRRHKLSKYNAWEPADLPEPGFVLVIDQTRGDASIRLGGAHEADFAAMLSEAKAAHPDRRIVVRTHPEVSAAKKRGHFGTEDCDARTELFTAPANPWDLLERAEAVYCVTSQMGFEALMAGHRPVVFGQPYYAGWGLTEDRKPLARRTARRSVEEVFAAAMLLYPTWVDPCRDRLCDFEEAALQLAEAARAWRENARGAVCVGMKPWKHAPMRAFLKGAKGVPRFEHDPEKAAALARAEGREVIVWAGKETPELRAACGDDVPLRRMEDGFLRSVGLGAQLLPAASLVLDDEGIYFDPTRPSRMERLIAEACVIGAGERARAEALLARVVAAKVTKYNVGAEVPELRVPAGKRVVLVPGQVEDDASIRLGTGEVSTNLALLRRARARFPDEYVIYKPHPDVEIGLRKGAIAETDLAGLADFVARDMSAADLMDRADVIVTMTSLMGFEGLMRGLEVHCLGMPFYAGWGLTEDHGQVCDRRVARPDLVALVHASLITYPRYFDPVSGRACSAEVILDRLAERVPQVSRNPLRRARWLAAVQYRLRGFAHLWR